MGRRRTHEEFVTELYEINPNIEVLGKYEGQGKGKTIECRCKIDGHVWSPPPHRLLAGRGCSKCKLTKKHEKFMENFSKNNPNSKDIEVLGKFTKSKIKIECRCKIDGHVWTPTPKSLLQGIGCSECDIRKRTQTHEKFMENFSKNNPNFENIEVLGEYVNNATVVECRCKIDGHVWTPIPQNLVTKGHGCSECGIRKRTQTHEKFMDEFSKNNPNSKDIEVLGEYKNNRTPIECRCKIDGHVWTPRPSDLKHKGSGCPKCKANKTRSQNEIWLVQLIKGTYPQLEVDENNRKILNGLELDIAIHNIDLYIEWNGIYWHSKKEAKEKDALKKQLLGDNLIQIVDKGGKDKQFVIKMFKKHVRPEIRKRLTTL